MTIQYDLGEPPPNPVEVNLARGTVVKLDIIQHQGTVYNSAREPKYTHTIDESRESFGPKATIEDWILVFI